MSAYFEPGSAARTAWREGRAVCPLCNRQGCRGQCTCSCTSCKTTPLADYAFADCDLIREMRARQAPGGAEAYRKAYREELAARVEQRVSWADCLQEVTRAGAPPRTVQAARNPDQSREFLKQARQWWTHKRGGKPALLLSGGVGAGKSVAAAYLAAKFAESRGCWRTGPGGSRAKGLVWLHAEALAQVPFLDDKAAALVELAGACEFLVVDELGTQGTSNGRLALGQLLARRLDSGKPLVITTNVASSKLFSEALGSHVADRLRITHCVRSEEQSMRGAA